MDRADLDEAELSAADAPRRLFCAALSDFCSRADPGASTPPGAPIALGEEAARHARVLRLGVGDALHLFDGRGATLPVRIEALARGGLRCVATGSLTRVPRGPELVLVQCLVKGRKLDDIVRMTTELGVAAIHLALSERCVVQRTERDAHKAARLLRIAGEAARQSEQPYLPEIMEPAPLEQVLARAPAEAARLALTERTDADFPRLWPAPSAWLVVGPEGGLSSSDREILSHGNFAPAGLGRAILRTETAAVVGVALGLNHLGRAPLTP